MSMHPLLQPQLTQHHNGSGRKILAILASVLIGLIAPALVQAEPARQISMSAAQMQRSGIQTEAALTAIDSATPAGEQAQHISGTVVASTAALSMVSAAVGGVVQKIHVNSLQQVQAGTPIATLFSQQLMEMQREYLHLAIQARLGQEKKARDEILYQEGIIALARLQESRGNAMQSDVAARERHGALRAAGLGDDAIRKLLINNTLSPHVVVRAGARGTLLELTLTLGQRIEAGMPMARIVRKGALWVEFQASRKQTEQVHLGDVLQLKGCGAAKVIAISPQVDGSNQSTLIRAQAMQQDGCLQLNQFVEASHIGGGGPAGSVAVPAAAVVRNGADHVIFVKNDKGFEAVKVAVTPGSGEKVWVAGKLHAGSRVAVKGIVALKGAWIGLGSEADAGGAR